MTVDRAVNAKFVRVRAPSCVVPKVVGLSIAKAKTRLVRAHCAVGAVTRAASSVRNEGKVLAQSPKSHRTLRHGARINLTGKGPRRSR
jgi:beta-lactam-binding protein with PASTA domain